MEANLFQKFFLNAGAIRVFVGIPQVDCAIAVQFVPAKGFHLEGSSTTPIQCL